VLNLELIRQNPYHVIGILAGANQRAIAKQRAKINAFQKVGKIIEFDSDLEFTGNPDRSNDALKKAFSNIEINQNKLLNSLFWFTNNNHLDETALTYLQSGDLEKAEDIWEKITNGKDVSSKNFSAFNNLGTLKLATTFSNGSIDFENLKDGVRLKTDLIISGSFRNFCYLVADETYTVEQEKELETFINALLEETNNLKISEAKKIPALIGSVHSKLNTLVSSKLTDSPLHNIERKIEQTRKKRPKNPSEGLNLAKKLYRDTKSDLNTLSEILEKSDLKYKVLADKLAKELLQCGIDYFIDLQKKVESINNQQIDEVVDAFTYAQNVAVGNQTNERIKENIDALTEIKFREVHDLIHLLNEIIKIYKSTEYDILTGQKLVVNDDKVIKFLKNVMTDDVLRKAANINNKDTLSTLIDRLEEALISIGRSQYTYKKVKFLSSLITNQEEISKRLENLAFQIKPNAASVTANATSVAEKANYATGGCLGSIAGYALLIFIFWLLAMIFG